MKARCHLLLSYSLLLLKTPLGLPFFSSSSRLHKTLVQPHYTSRSEIQPHVIQSELIFLLFNRISSVFSPYLHTHVQLDWLFAERQKRKRFPCYWVERFSSKHLKVIFTRKTMDAISCEIESVGNGKSERQHHWVSGWGREEKHLSLHFSLSLPLASGGVTRVCEKSTETRTEMTLPGEMNAIFFTPRQRKYLSHEPEREREVWSMNNQITFTKWHGR